MINQLQHVARTYATRRSLWLLGVFGLFSFGPSAALLIAGGRVERVPPMLAAIGIAFPVALTSYVLVTQAKWQFCDSRARLIPEFTGPHLIVTSFITLFAFGLYPAVLTLSGRWSPLGVSACAIVIAAGSIWTMHSGQWLAAVIAFAAYLSLMTQPGLEFWIHPDDSRRLLPVHAVLLGLGWAAVAAWLVRLPRLREEDDDYFIPIQGYQGPATRMERTQSARALARVMVRSRWNRLPGDWWHDRLAHIRATTAHERQRLLRYGFAPTPIWVSAISMAGMFFAMFYFMARSGALSRGGPTQSILPSLNIMIIMPTLISTGMLAMRRGRMAQELLLPLGRRQYVDGLFRAVATSSAVTWATAHAAVLALLAALSPEMLTPSFVIGLTALSLSVQIYAFGVAARISPNLSGGKRMLLMMAVIMTAAIPLMLGIQTLGHPGVTREQAVADALAAESLGFAAQPPDVREQLANDPLRIANTRRNAEVAWERTQPWPAAWLWSIVGVTTAIGAAATVNSRRRWLEYELG